MYRNQLRGRVFILTGFTGDNEEFVQGSISVVAERILPWGETALSHANRSWTLVAVFPAILTDDVGQITRGSHILEGGMQKGVFRLTVLGIIINHTHCLVTLKGCWLNVLNCKPFGLGDILRPSKYKHWYPESQQQEEKREASQHIWHHLSFQLCAEAPLRTEAVDISTTRSLFLVLPRKSELPEGDKEKDLNSRKEKL